MKIFKSVFLIFAMAVLAIGATGANYSDTETVAGNTFAAGTLELQIGQDEPTSWSFNGSNLAPGANMNFDADIKNTGSINGDASIDIAVSNSVEGANPTSEGDTTLPGDLDEQIRICFYMQEDQGSGGFNNVACGYAKDLNGTTIDIPDAYDNWINDDSTDSRIRVRAWFVDDTDGMATGFDNNDAMADSFNLDLTFHLDQ